VQNGKKHIIGNGNKFPNTCRGLHLGLCGEKDTSLKTEQINLKARSVAFESLPMELSMQGCKRVKKCKKTLGWLILPLTKFYCASPLQRNILFKSE
jgi:hypothetical protein